MLDENLPTFLLKTSTDKSTQNLTLYYTQHGSDAEPAYALRYPEPDLPTARNQYASALYDAHNPDVLFAEVLLLPDWTQPSLSAEAIRLNGGVAPPPAPLLPGEFTVRLYNPDQQVKVTQKRGAWGSAPSWEFEMPQQSFRQPSTSSIDRTQRDPAASETTPRLGFKWKKDSKFAKDLACFLSGATVNADGSKRKNKEPDITVALFHALKTVTLYEPNLQRVHIEDMKGLEVVLLLSAVVIRDVYFGQIEQAFRISGHPQGRKTSTSPRPSPSVLGLGGANPASPTGPLQMTNSPGKAAVPVSSPQPQRQWETNAEMPRRKKQAEAEMRERRRRESTEQKRVKKMLESEEQERQRRQSEIDKETERLRRIYGTSGQTVPNLPPRPVASLPHRPFPRVDAQVPGSFPRPQHVYQPPLPRPAWHQPAPSPYLQAPGGYASQSGFFSHAGSGPQPKLKEKRSLFGFRRENDATRLYKKRSSMF